MSYRDQVKFTVNEETGRIEYGYHISTSSIRGYTIYDTGIEYEVCYYLNAPNNIEDAIRRTYQIMLPDKKSAEMFCMWWNSGIEIDLFTFMEKSGCKILRHWLGEWKYGDYRKD